MANIGLCFDRTTPPSLVRDVAEGLEAGGVDQLWVIEDCFYTTGISLAATALARTERLTVGLGILPAVARNPAITAMELATLCNLAPGRVIAGIGHGVQSWMEQIGARTPSPLTTLDEVLTTVRALLRGETVDVEGREVTMRNVVLDQPPAAIPPVLAGVRGPKSLELAGRRADGIVLAEAAGPTFVSWARRQADATDGFRTSVFSALCLIDDDAAAARRIMSPFVARLLSPPTPEIAAHPHIDEIVERFEARGEDGIADMPADWWTEIGAIGSLDDVVEHVEALVGAGTDDVSLFPGPGPDLAMSSVQDAIRIRRAIA